MGEQEIKSLHECCVIAMGTVADLREADAAAVGGGKESRLTCGCGRIWECRDRGAAGWAWYRLERSAACNFDQHTSCAGCGCECHLPTA
jgi:hypothetical protein